MRTVKKELEAALGSKTKLKILVSIAQERNSLTRYQIQRKSGVNPSMIKKSVKDLVDQGWIKEIDSTPKKYMLNMEKEVVKEFVHFLRKIGVI